MVLEVVKTFAAGRTLENDMNMFIRLAVLGLSALLLTAGGGRALSLEPALEPAPRPTLRVVSYNIQHGAGMDRKLDLERTADVLRRLEPDLVALQEVDENCRRSKGVDQAAELGRLLGMEHRFGEFMDYDGGRSGLAVFSFHMGAAAAPPELLRKFGFDLDRLDVDGLSGPADGKTSITYEFRIPDTPENRAAVKAIDPETQISVGPRGRVDAGPGFALCIGSTHQPRYREILLALARLPFVELIQECVFER
jgi:hypothetical protein